MSVYLLGVPERRPFNIHNDNVCVSASFHAATVLFLRGAMYQECGGLAAARAVMEEAEAEVTDTYGGFVRFTDDQDLDEHEDGNGHLPEAGEGGGASGRRVAV